MKSGAQGRYRASSKLDLSNRFERALIGLFVLSLAGCSIGLIILFNLGIVQDMIMVLPVITFSFVIVGLVVYLDVGRWQYLLGLLAVVLLMLLAGVELMYSLFLVYAIMGGFGVVGLVVAFQKRYFYSLMSRIEALGLKGHLGRRDRLLAYIFNIREDTDTRNLVMDHNLSRNGLPIRDMLETMTLGFMLGIFIWIYLSLNPALLSNYGLSDILLIMFLLSLYIPLLVLPWTIFKSLNVRISSEFRDFHLFRGVVTTLQKTVLPLAAIFIYTISAVNNLGLDVVMGYIFTSAVFNILVVGATTVIFYTFFEKELVYSIVSKWRVFRPMPILSELREREDRHRSKDFAGTPEREYTESGELDFTPYR